jgi:hypothetical protein
MSESLLASLEPVLACLPPPFADLAAVDGLRRVARVLPDSLTEGPIGLELRLRSSDQIDLFGGLAPSFPALSELVSSLRSPGSGITWADSRAAVNLAECLERWFEGRGEVEKISRFALIECDAAPEPGSPVPVPSIFLSPKGLAPFGAPPERNAFHTAPRAVVRASAELMGEWADPDVYAAYAQLLARLPDTVEVFAVGAMIPRGRGSSMRIALRGLAAADVGPLLRQSQLRPQADILGDIASSTPADRLALALEVGPGAETRVGLEISPSRDWREASFDAWPEILDHLDRYDVMDTEARDSLQGLLGVHGGMTWGLAHIKVAADDSRLLPVAKAYVGLLRTTESVSSQREPVGGVARRRENPGTREPVIPAVVSALAAIDASLGSSGQWSGEFGVVGDPDGMRKDSSPALTAQGILALWDVGPAAALRERSREHVRRTVLPGGLWRYFANIPADVDDSAMCALALGDDARETAQTGARLLSLQTREGRFPTWFEPGWDPAFDAVTDAHALAWIGASKSTHATAEWLRDIVLAEGESRHLRFYRDALDLHVALCQALDRGVALVGPGVAAAAARAETSLNDGNLSSHRRAQAILVALHGSAPSTAIGAAVDRLVAQQSPDGLWEPEVLYSSRTVGTGLPVIFRSRTVTSALCVAAIWRAHRMRTND